MTFPILAAFLVFVGAGVIRTWKLRRNPEAWPPWLACVVAAVGIASVLFDREIDAALGGTNWVFILETWSVYIAYTLMTETCRAVRRDSPIQLRAWVIGLVVTWCAGITILFATLEGREGTRPHFVRDMFPQPQSLGIALMYSLGIVVLGVLPLYWLRSEKGASAWLIRIGTAMVVVAHAARLIVSPIDFFNGGQATAPETLLYQLFVPVFYLGVASFAFGLMGLSLRRWHREVFQMRQHLRALSAIASEHGIEVRDASPVAHLVAIEDAIRVERGGMLTELEYAQVATARSWLARTHSSGPFKPDAQVSST